MTHLKGNLLSRPAPVASSLKLQGPTTARKTRNTDQVTLVPPPASQRQRISHKTLKSNIPARSKLVAAPMLPLSSSSCSSEDDSDKSDSEEEEQGESVSGSESEIEVEQGRKKKEEEEQQAEEE